uniref:Uncharacterized protein n=1 Tax=Rhizophora mucronata TaxID=61149 RepID=A0A2P2LCA9_RHIMU
MQASTLMQNRVRKTYPHSTFPTDKGNQKTWECWIHCVAVCQPFCQFCENAKSPGCQGSKTHG